MRRLLFLSFLILSLGAFASEIRGVVFRVADGDTVTIRDGSGRKHKIRLNKIDAPELEQAYGRQSRQYLSSLIFGKNVRVIYQERDRYDRILGIIYLDEKEINFEMVKAGYAWHYKYYDSTPEYAKAEVYARYQKAGLWKDPSPVQPYYFRKARRRR